METKDLISLIFLLQAIINGVSLSIAQKPELRINHQSFMCSKKGDLNSDLIVDRERALAILLKNIGNQGSNYTGTQTGQGDLGISSIALFPPNIKLEVYHECVNITITYLKNKCPKQKGVAWTALERVFCMVRYADYSFTSNLSEWAYATFSSPPNQSPSNPAELEKELNNLANKLKGMVTQVNFVKRYGSGSVTFGPGSRTLYGSMQCTYGIAEAECVKCLSDITNRVHKCCSKQRSLYGIAASTNCYFWYHHNNILPKAIVSSTSLHT